MKGYALLIGVNEVDKNHYGGPINLHCAKTDVIEMSNLLCGIPYYHGNVKSFLGENATIDRIESEIIRLNTEVVANEAHLVIYFTGHGASIPGDVHGEGNESIGYFCFYDRMVSEFQIRALLQKIDPKFSVFLISDSCNSGQLIDQFIPRSLKSLGHLKLMNDGTYEELPLPHLKRINNSFAQRVFKDSKNIDHYENNLKEYPNLPFSPDAEIAILTACGRTESTETNHQNGMPSAFTRSLLVNWSLNMSAGYDNYLNLVRKNRADDQVPQLKFYGSKTSDFFFNTRPFAYHLRNTGVEDLYSDEHFTDKRDDNLVEFLKFPQGSHYVFKDSDSFLIGKAPSGLINSMRLLGCNLTDVEVVAVIKASIQTTGDPLPAEIEKFTSVADNSPHAAQGYIVVIDKNITIIDGNYTSAIKHKGRTQGKVSNDLGDFI